MRQVEFEAVEPDAVVLLFDWLAWAEVPQVLAKVGLPKFNDFAAPHTQFVFVVGIKGRGVEDDGVTWVFLGLVVLLSMTAGSAGTLELTCFEVGRSIFFP